MFDDFEKPIYPEFHGNPDLLGDEPQPKPPLPEISTKLREWRGKRGLRVAVPLLSDAISHEVTIGMFANIERGALERVPASILSAIETYIAR